MKPFLRELKSFIFLLRSLPNKKWDMDLSVVTLIIDLISLVLSVVGLGYISHCVVCRCLQSTEVEGPVVVS